MSQVERAEVQRNRYYSPRSTARASEGEPFDDRLSDIANRHGKDSFQYIKAKSCPEQLIAKGFSFASDIVLDERSMSQD